jgi:hypothetical protein
MEESCELCEPMECPFCKQKEAYIIVVRGKRKVICYRKGCKFEMELPEEYKGRKLEDVLKGLH